MTEQERHSEIRNLLKNLESVRASSDFEKKLHLKIIEEERRKRTGHAGRQTGIADFFQQILSGRSYPWLAPAAGFVVLLFFVLYYVYSTRTVDTQQRQATPETVVQKDSGTVSQDIARTEDMSGDERSKSPEGTITSPKTESGQELSSKPHSYRPEPQTSEKEETGSPDVTGSMPAIQNMATDRADEKQQEQKESAKEMPEEEVKEPAKEETQIETMQARESETQLMPKAGMEKSIKDTAKKNASKKLDSLSRKWLEEIEVKVRETNPGK